MLKLILTISIGVVICFMQLLPAYAAVGCSLNDPDRDIKRIFPASTGYITAFITIKEKGGKVLAEEVEEKLGDKLDPIYESLDVPYAYYSVLKGKEIIGYVHGVNQKGTYGGMQIILATDKNGKIIGLYYQKISSPESKKFREPGFTNQFIGLTLADFYQYDLSEGAEKKNNRIAKINDPTQSNQDDFLATLRGIKKNLILFDEFILNNKYDRDYNRLKGGTK